MLHYFDRLVFHSSFPEQLACPSDPVVLPLPNARVVANETCRFFAPVGISCVVESQPVVFCFQTSTHSICNM